MGNQPLDVKEVDPRVLAASLCFPASSERLRDPMKKAKQMGPDHLGMSHRGLDPMVMLLVSLESLKPRVRGTSKDTLATEPRCLRERLFVASFHPSHVKTVSLGLR